MAATSRRTGSRRGRSSASRWLDRSEWWWGLYEKDTLEDQYFVYGIEGDDGLAGYLSFEQKPADGWGYQIFVEELIAREPAAAVA